MPQHQMREPEHGRKQMVSYFLGLAVQLSSAPAKYKMKRLSFHRAPHTRQAGVVAVAATASSGERSLGGTDRAEWFASQMLREAMEIQSQQKKGNEPEMWFGVRCALLSKDTQL
ncbi:unnamed protein product [Gulo gulo]|uniref:Uncharacterized protein n=1 Tax=Gulo gulo TaxID=48420 RepID=A0A9X9LX54_GULGU|nr:unnamed protein product [Gulo gulo]